MATLADEVGIDVAYHVATDLSKTFGARQGHFYGAFVYATGIVTAVYLIGCGSTCRLGGSDVNVLKDMVSSGFLGEET